MLIRRFECADTAETARLAAKIREGIEVPFLMTLQGDLGAGKTELVRDILEGYGITSVKSPTFTKEGLITRYNFQRKERDFCLPLISLFVTVEKHS